MSTITLKSETVGAPTQLLIGGHWIDASDGRTFDVDDPSTGEGIAQTFVVPASSKQQRSQTANGSPNESFGRVTIESRGEMERALEDAIESRAG